MTITTTPNIEGKRVVRYLGIVDNIGDLVLSVAVFWYR